MSNITSNVFQNIGLLSVYIINESGIPLLTRNYEGSQPVDQENIMIGGFLGAISLFAQGELISYISDIGIYRKRLFFKYQAGFIYVMVFYENKLTTLTLQQFHELIEIIIWRLTSEFKTFYDKTARTSNYFQLTKEIENYGPMADVLLEQGCFEWQKTLDAQSNQFSEVNEHKDETSNIFEFNPLIKRFGIQGIYIIDKTNSPIYTRIYNTENILIINKRIMTSFFAAINSFIQNTLVSEVSDVGMFNQRILVKQQFPYTYIVVIDALVHLSTSRGEGRFAIDTFIKDLNQELKIAVNSKKIDFTLIEAIQSFDLITDQLLIKFLTEYELALQMASNVNHEHSENIDANHPLYKEFFNTIEDISKYFADIKDGGLGDVKLKVRIRNKLGSSKSILTDVISQPDYDFDQVTRISYSAITKLNSILSSLPRSKLSLEFWFELNAFSNEFLLLVFDLYKGKNLEKITLHNQEIKDLLQGVPVIADFPGLIEIPIENAQSREKWLTVFKSLQLCANVFYLIGNNLLSLSENELTKYVSTAFCHTKLLLSMYQMFDWQRMASYENKPAEGFFRAIKDKLITYLYLFDHIVQVYKRIDNDMETNVVKCGLVQDLSLEQLFILNNEFRTLCLESKSKLEDLYQNGTFDYNDNPNTSPHIHDIDFIIIRYNFYEAYFDVMNIGLVKTSPNTDINVVLVKINRVLDLVQRYQVFLEQQAGDKKKLIKSPILGEYINNLIMFIEILALNAYWTNNEQLYQIQISRYTWLFTQIDITTYTDLFIIRLLAELFIDTHVSSYIHFKDFRDNIIKYRKVIVERSRDYASLTVLEAILSFFVGDKQISELEGLLFDAKEKGLVNGGQDHLLNMFEHYTEVLTKLFRNQSAEYPVELLERTKKVYKLDSISWLIPNFSNIRSNTVSENIIYIPFNRSYDAIT